MSIRSPWRLSLVACAAALVACGGGNGVAPVATPDAPNTPTPAPTVGKLSGQAGDQGRGHVAAADKCNLHLNPYLL